MNNIIAVFHARGTHKKGGGELGGMTVHMNFKMNHLTNKERHTNKSDNWGNA